MGLLFGLLFVGIGLFALFRGLVQYRTGKASSGWPSVKGKVTLATVNVTSSTDEDGSTSKRYSPRVEYTYSVSGRNHSGSQVVIGSQATYGSRAGAEAKLTYRSGQQVDVYYNPEKPSQAVLEAGAVGGAWGTLLIGIVFAVVGAVVIFFNLRG